ncbi:peptidase M10, partial [Haemophilus haemolyticus]
MPDVKTAELVSSKDGSVIAPSTDSKLQEALKAAKDELAAAATPEQKEAAENKVKAAETALNKALDDKGVATAKNVADMINKSGFTLKTSATAEGNKESGDDEVINPGKAVEMVAGKNLTVKQEANGKVTYSLNPVLSNLTSAEFKGSDANAPTTKLTNEGVTITPETSTGKNPVSLTQNGLNNGGNAITNVAGNLDGAKTGTNAPTTSATKPTLGTAANEVNSNNAATVGDVLNAGWNLQGNNTAKDFVTAYDTVNFIDGEGTSVSVENKDKITSTIKYSVNLGDGLEKTNDNKIKAKAGDGVTVGTDGIKVNTGKGLKIDVADNNKVAVDTDDKTITVGNDGKVKAVTGSTEVVTADNKTGTEKAGQVRPVATDKDKLATVDTVAQAVNSAKWIAKATNADDVEITDTDKTNDTTGEGIAAGDEVTFTAGKNLRVKREGKNFTFATAKDVSFDSVKVGDTQNGKAPVNLTTEGATTANNNEAGKAPTTALNISSGTGTDAKPTQLVGVGSVLNKTTFDTTPTGTVPAGGTPTTEDLVNLNEAVNKNAAATVGDLQNMGWKVSSDKATGAEGAYLDVVKNANEVKFVGKNAAKVSGKTENGVRTITIDVPDVKTAELVSSKDGSVIAPSTDSKLQEALKAAKDELAAAATPEQKEAAENKVKAAETALNKALDDKGVATAKNVADMINKSGFTLKTSATAEGNKESGDDEVINPGKAVEMVAGKNLTVKQEANGKVTYS